MGCVGVWAWVGFQVEWADAWSEEGSNGAAVTAGSVHPTSHHPIPPLALCTGTAPSHSTVVRRRLGKPSRGGLFSLRNPCLRGTALAPTPTKLKLRPPGAGVSHSNKISRITTIEREDALEFLQAQERLLREARAARGGAAAGEEEEEEEVDGMAED